MSDHGHHHAYDHRPEHMQDQSKNDLETARPLATNLTPGCP